MKTHSASQIIQHASNFLKDKKRKIAVIDLDSTLYNVSARQIQIFKEFAATEKFKLQFPNETKVLQQIAGKNLAYYPVDCLKQAGLTDIHKDFSATYHEFWSPRFFSNNYLKYDEIEAGAADFMLRLEEEGFRVVFLTGRDILRMGTGTEEQLKRDHMLINDRQLILKPHLSEDDHSFKLRIVHDLCSNETGLLFIDNEAKNLNHIYKESLAVVCVFFDTVHSGKAEPLEELELMRSFVL